MVKISNNIFPNLDCILKKIATNIINPQEIIWKIDFEMISKSGSEYWYLNFEGIFLSFFIYRTPRHPEVNNWKHYFYYRLMDTVFLFFSKSKAQILPNSKKIPSSKSYFIINNFRSKK